MPFQVDLIFAGLCADVLDRPREDGPTELIVLMPFAKTVGDRVNGKHVAVHLPVAILSAEDSIGGSGKLVHDLSSRTVRLDAAFEGDPQPLSLILDDTDDSYSHVLQMSSISPRFAKVHPDCLEPSPSSAHLSARIHVTAGVVSSHELRNALQTFPPSGAADRKVAHRIRCRLSNLRSLALQATLFDDPTDVLHIPVQPADGVAASVFLGNLCDDDLLEFLGGPAPSSESETQVDTDFAAYYRLAQEDVTKEPTGTLPVPVAQDGGGGKTRCNRVELKR